MIFVVLNPETAARAELVLERRKMGARVGEAVEPLPCAKRLVWKLASAEGSENVTGTARLFDRRTVRQ